MILITGCGGYIGRHLARTLCSQGMVVRGLDRRAAGLAPLAESGVESFVGEVSDPVVLAAALTGVTVVYHLAGSALGNSQEIVRANVDGARAVAEACKQAGAVQALIFAGSGALYPSGTGWLDELTAPAPGFAYAQAKFEAERVLLQAYDRDGVPVVIGRIAGVYGPGSPNLMTELVRKGRFPLIGGGHGLASYIHIEDTVAGLLTLAKRGKPGEIYNLADDQPATVRDFYRHWAALLGGPPPPSLAPLAAQLLVGMVNGIARIRGQPGPLPADMVAMASVSHRMSNRRMREALGLLPRYPSYREGLPSCVPAQAGA